MTLATPIELPALDGSAPGAFGRSSRRRWGLRRRILLIFTLGALFLSLVLAFVTYTFARSSVVGQHDSDARASARKGAIIVSEALRSQPTSAEPAMTSLESFGIARPLVWYNSDWRAGDPSYSDDLLPDALVRRVIDQGVASKMVIEVGNEPNLAIGF